MSKQEVEKFCETSFEENVAIISISDYGDEFAYLKNSPEKLLRIHFDDVDNDVIKDELGNKPDAEDIKRIENKYHMFREDQALRIAWFYFSVKDSVDILICQCEYGQSRSAAIAAAFLEYKNRSGIKIFANDRYYPNKVVFRKVLTALKDFATIENMSAKDFVEKMWGKEILNVIENEVINSITMDEFLDHCTAFSDCSKMYLSGIEELYPKVYDAIPNQMGEFSWRCICNVLELLEIK